MIRPIFALLILASLYALDLALKPAPLLADEEVIVIGQPAAAGPSYLLNADFEGSASADAALWSVTGSPNWDYTTAPAPLIGSQSVSLGSGVEIIKELGGVTEIWAAGMFSAADITPASSTTIIGFADSANVTRCYMSLRTGGTVRFYLGGANNYTTAALSNSTTYYWKMHLTRVSDGNDTCDFWLQTSPTWGTPTYSHTGGTFGATSIDDVRLTGTAEGIVHDQVRVDDADIANY